MQPRILLVEDEESIAEIIIFNLEAESYLVSWVKSGSDALSKFKSERFDLIILDIMLPKLNGFDVFESIRLENARVPILFVTARNDKEDILKGLSLGADDYITKPFDLDEFLLRVRNHLKRSLIKESYTDDQYYEFYTHRFDYKSLSAKANGVELKLSKKEAQLLKLLLDHQNTVVSRDLILERIWGYDVYPTTRTIDNFILRLRKHFEENPKKPKIFMSVRGVGYQMIVTDETQKP